MKCYFQIYGELLAKKKKKVPEPEKKQRGVQGDDERMRSEHRERGKSWI